MSEVKQYILANRDNLTLTREMAEGLTLDDIIFIASLPIFCVAFESFSYLSDLLAVLLLLVPACNRAIAGHIFPIVFLNSIEDYLQDNGFLETSFCLKISRQLALFSTPTPSKTTPLGMFLSVTRERKIAVSNFIAKTADFDDIIFVAYTKNISIRLFQQDGPKNYMLLAAVTGQHSDGNLVGQEYANQIIRYVREDFCRRFAILPVLHKLGLYQPDDRPFIRHYLGTHHTKSAR